MTADIQNASNPAALLLRDAALTPERIGLQILRPQGTERWSYERIITNILGIGGGMRARGLGPGDVVMLAGDDVLGRAMGAMAAMAAGLIPVWAEQDTHFDATAAMLARQGITGRRIERMDVANLHALHAHAPSEWVEGQTEPRIWILRREMLLPRAVAYPFEAGERVLIVSDNADRGARALLTAWVRGATALVPQKGLSTAQILLLARRFDVQVLAATSGSLAQMMEHGLPHLPRLQRLEALNDLAPGQADAWSETTSTPALETLA